MDTRDEAHPMPEGMDGPEHHAQTPAPSLPSLPSRLLAVFVSPGTLTAALVESPRWLGALLVSAALVALQMGLMPAEVFAESQRQAALDAGRDFPELSERALMVIRIVTPIVTAASTIVLSFLFAGIYTFVFAFVLGDEGGYRRYLAMVTHAWFIPALVGLFLTPLRISTADPQLSLNLASFMYFLPDGYLLQVLRFLDLTQLWSSLVVAQGAHAIDRTRSFGSAAAILIGIVLAFALVLARLVPS